MMGETEEHREPLLNTYIDLLLLTYLVNKLLPHKAEEFDSLWS